MTWYPQDHPHILLCHPRHTVSDTLGYTSHHATSQGEARADHERSQKSGVPSSESLVINIHHPTKSSAAWPSRSALKQAEAAFLTWTGIPSGSNQGLHEH